MALALPREVLLGTAVILIQVIYSQLYPIFFKGNEYGKDIVSEHASSAGREHSKDIASENLQPVRSTSGDSERSEQDWSERSTATEKQKPGESDHDEKVYHFAGSTTVRSRPKKNSPKFKVGELVRDKIMFVRGVVVGWDATCQAPSWWKSSHHAPESWRSAPHYLILVDIRDIENTAFEGAPSINATVYSPQAQLEKIGKDGNPIVNPNTPYFFSLFETASGLYVPVPHIARLYPDDIHPHYQTGSDSLPDADPRGRPLLRVVELGRLIAHGSPVPVVRKGMFLVATEDLHDEYMFGKTAIILLEHSDDEGTLGVIVNKNLSASKRDEMHKSAKQVVSQLEGILRQHERSGKNEGALRDFANSIEIASATSKLLRAPFVDVRIGGPVGLQEFPAGPHHLVLHPFKDIKGSKLALRGSGAKDDPDLFLSFPHLMRPKDIGNFAKRAAAMTDEERAAGQRVILFAGNSAWGAKQLAGEIRGSLHGAPSWAWLPGTTRDIIKLNGTSGEGFWNNLLSSPALQRLETK